MTVIALTPVADPRTKLRLSSIDFLRSERFSKSLAFIVYVS
jgi:hypothetical protein